MTSRLSEVINTAVNRPEYSDPISNITYHLPESPHPNKSDIAAKAFQRILDNYDENERLADAFQVELDRQQQITNERKAEERRKRLERRRQAKEEKRNKRQSKGHRSLASTSTAATPPPPAATGSLSIAALAHAFQQRHGRFAAAGYSLVGPERRSPIDTNVNTRSRQSSECSFRSSSGLYGSAGAHEREIDNDKTQMIESKLDSTDDQHTSHHSQFLIHSHGQHSNPIDRSLSSLPILPLTPSPCLKPSESTFGTVTRSLSPVIATGATSIIFPTPSTLSSGRPDTTSTCINFPSVPCSNSNNNSNNPNISLPTPPPQPLPPSATLPMRNKRKQAIPVHPSVIKRIPGITFRIQPDLDQHLQVEILKSIDDYHSTTSKDSQLAVQDENLSSHGFSTSNLQETHDLNKIQQSIISSRPGYASLFIPEDSSAYDDPYFRDNRETSPHSVVMHAAPNTSNSTRFNPYQRHSRNGSYGSNHSVSIHTPTKGRSRSSSSSNIWAPYAPSAAGLAMLLSDVVAARATLPLSWNNFSTRECQVNKVIGKNGQDFEQLEAAVQETVARHQAAAIQQEFDEEMKENGSIPETHKQEHNSSVATGESSVPGSSIRKKRNTSTVTPPLSATQRTVTVGSRATRSHTHRSENGRSSRVDSTDLVEGYDDIERILKAKRQKKRQQQKNYDNQSRGVSEATTEGDFDTDINMDLPRIKEDIDDNNGSSTLSISTDNISNNEAENSRTHSKRSATNPPSPPHSRQVTPAAKLDLGSSLHASHPGSSLSRTPPATPTRASTRLHQDTGIESTPISKTRARARSFSTTIHTDAKTNFFESALEMIEAKRRQSIAKKKASAAGTTNVSLSDTTPTIASADAQQDQQLDEHPQEVNHQLNQEIMNPSTQNVMVPNSNIPKSSKLLPGRVLRKPRAKLNYDGSDHEASTDQTRRSSLAGAGEAIYDPDCSSCRLEVSDVDRAFWKKACQTGEIHLNPKTWGRTAILCCSCRTQYLRHGLRCTQCFYVPVWNPESTSNTATSASGAFTMPKPGGTCKRCKAGTWFREV
ncbi:hypothetical protein FBU30_004728 [Linnemannia zychae]|nr:hypothetical protein FBU30_004728 [Linnemannia zychae]